MIQNELSDKDIERGLWYLRNKAKIKKAFMIGLCVFIFFTFAYSIPNFILIKIQDSKDKKTSWATVDFSKLKSNPQDINILDKQAIASGSGKYDLIASVQNPNQGILLSNISYKFVYSGGESDTLSDFILPGETKRLVLKDVRSENLIDAFDIKIVDMRWRKLKKSEIDFAPKEVFYSIDNDKLSSSNSESSNRSWAKFSIKNNSPYNFKSVNVYIIASSGSTIYGVEKLDIDNFYSKEERDLEVGWFYKIPSYANLVIEADTNVFDKNNYINNR